MIETTEYFKQQVLKNDNLARLSNDISTLFLENSTDYKINKSLELINQQQKETIAPISELFLLSHLFNRTGYNRLPRAMEVKATIISDDTIGLEKNTRFSDGENIFLLEGDVQLQSDIETEVIFSLKEIYKTSFIVDSGTLFFHYPLNTEYRDLTDVKLYKNNKELIYSQNFVAIEGEWSYEIMEDGKMQVVILLENEKANNITLNDVIEIEIFTTVPRTEIPAGLGIIGDGYNLIVKDIQSYKDFYSGLSLQDMKDIVKYGRNNIGDIVINEDYYQKIMTTVENIKILKVWQEREEEMETVSSVSNINKVFICYLNNNDTRTSELDNKIISTIQDDVYGKEVILRDANIIDLYATVSIEAQSLFNDSLKQDVKNILVNYYDDHRNKIDKDVLYTNIFRLLDYSLGGESFKLNIELSDKGDYRNNKIYRIINENINVLINGI